MPGSLNGLELAGYVRANWPDMKIIILSAQSEVDFAVGAVDGFLRKPHWSADLIECVNRLLGIP